MERNFGFAAAEGAVAGGPSTIQDGSPVEEGRRGSRQSAVPCETEGVAGYVQSLCSPALSHLVAFLPASLAFPPL